MGLSFSIQSNTTNQIVNNYINIISQLAIEGYNKANPQSTSVQNVTVSACNYNECWKGAPPDKLPSPSDWSRTCSITGGINVNQTATASNVVTASSLNEASQNVQNNISTSTQQYVENVGTQNPGWLQAAFGAQFNNSSFSQYLSAQIQNSISSDQTQICQSSIITQQTAALMVCTTVQGGITINQNASINNVVNCIMKQVVKQISVNSVINEVVQRGDNWAIKNESWTQYIIIIVVVVIIFLILGFVYKAYNKKDKERNVMVSNTPMITAPAG